MGMQLTKDLGHSCAQKPVERIDGVADTGFSRAFMSFAPVIVDAIRDGHSEIDEAATFEDGLRVQRVLDAARESSALGKAVAVG